MASHAEMTLRLEDITVLPDTMDQDVVKFKLSDLPPRQIDEKMNERMMEIDRDAGGDEKQCLAINFSNDPIKRKQCSATMMKGSDLCGRHSRQQMKGKKAVVLVQPNK